MQALFIGLAIFLVSLILGFTLKREGRVSIGGIATSVATWWAYGLVTIVPQLASIAIEALLKAFTINRQAWLVLVTRFVKEVTGEDLPIEELLAQAPDEPLLPFVGRFSDRIGGLLFDVIAPVGELTPEAGRKNAERAIALGTLFGMQDYWAHTVTELSTLGQFAFIADLPAAIESSFGLNRISGAVIRALVRKTISEPLGTYFNRLYTPAGLSGRQAIEAWQKELVGDEEVLSALKSEGYDYARALLLLNLAQPDFSLAQAEQLWRAGLIDGTKLVAMIRRQGYGAERAELLAILVQGRKLDALLEEVAQTARRLYRDGKLAEGELREALVEAGYRPAEIDVVLARENLELLVERDLSVAQILEAYREVILDDGEARARLRALRYGDGEIDVLLALQQKRLSAAAVIEAAIRGLISGPEAEQRLLAFGYRAEDVPLLLDLRTRRLTAGQVIDALTRGQLDQSGARAALGQLGFDPESIDILLAFRTRRLSPADIQAALLRGIISEEVARARLLDLGFPAADTEILLLLRFQLLSLGQVLDAYLAGLVTRASALGRLQQLGFGAEDAERLVLLVELRQPPSAP